MNLESDSPLYYLASPYSKYPGGIGDAWMVACENAALLMNHGVMVFSPIAHTHGIAVFGGLPGGFDFWERYDNVMMDVCDGIIMLKAESWEISAGMTAEHARFAKIGLPIIFMEPGEIPEELR
jgi:hypothetical protein